MFKKKTWHTRVWDSKGYDKLSTVCNLNLKVRRYFLLTGGTSFWIDFWEDFKEILGDIQDLFRLIFKKKEKIAAVNKKDELSTALTDGIQMTVCITKTTNILRLTSKGDHQHFLAFA